MYKDAMSAGKETAAAEASADLEEEDEAIDLVPADVEEKLEAAGDKIEEIVEAAEEKVEAVVDAVEAKIEELTGTEE